MRRNPKLFLKRPYIAVAVMLIGMIIFIIYGNHKLKALKKQSVISNGIVENFMRARGMSGVAVRYTFEVNGKNFEGSSRLLISDKRRTHLGCLLIGKQFPVVYQRTNPENSYMLLTTKNFVQFNVKIPSSVMKTIKYLDSLSNDKIPYDPAQNPCK